MRLHNEELDLLIETCKYLEAEGGRKDLAGALLKIINRLDEQREITRNANKKRASKNREKGYAWKSSHHPKKSKYSKGGDDNDLDGETR